MGAKGRKTVVLVWIGLAEPLPSDKLITFAVLRVYCKIRGFGQEPLSFTTCLAYNKYT